MKNKLNIFLGDELIAKDVEGCEIKFNTIKITKILIDNLTNDALEPLPEVVDVNIDFKPYSTIGIAKPYIIDGKLYADFEVSQSIKGSKLFPAMGIIKKRGKLTSELFVISLCQRRNADKSIKPITIK